MKSKRAKATDIPMSVKKKVFERDNGRCVVCGNNYNVMHWWKRKRKINDCASIYDLGKDKGNDEI